MIYKNTVHEKSNQGLDVFRNVLSTGNAKPQKLVWIFHGYGASGDDVIGLASQWPQDHYFYMAPHGIEPCGSNHAYQWFSLEDTTDPQPCQNAADTVCNEGESLLKTFGLTWSDVIVVGFSQGGALALELGLYHRPVRAVMVYAGFLMHTRPVVYRPRSFWAHGQEDEVVPYQKGLTDQQFFQDQKIPLEIHNYEKLGHNIHYEAVKAGETFLTNLDM